MYYTNPEREKDALQEAQSLRLAASQISKIKKVISDFEGCEKLEKGEIT